MEWFFDLICNPFLLAGTTSWLIAQIVKTIIYGILNRTFRAERLVGDGGMPSGHSATVTGLAFMCLLRCGAGTVEFAIALIFAIVVCHDAMGVRREAGKQAALLNDIVQILEGVAYLNAQTRTFLFHTIADYLAEIRFDILADDENNAAKAGGNGVMDGIIHDDFAVHANRRQLLDAAAKARADTGSHDEQCGFHGRYLVCM